MEAFARVYAAVEAFPAPAVCVCVGSVVGAGAEIAAGCDLRVGGDNLRLAWPGGRLGVPVGPARLVPLVGLARAKDLIFTGRAVDAAEALALGLLHSVAAADRAEAEAIALARRVAAHPPEGLRRLKALFRALDESGGRVATENAGLVAWAARRTARRGCRRRAPPGRRRADPVVAARDHERRRMATGARGRPSSRRVRCRAAQPANRSAAVLMVLKSP
jgi:enoyl-CoA hydratase/carnithine racemase